MENSVLDLFKSSFTIIFLWLLITFLLFLAIREIVLWYFKINEVVSNLNRIANSLEIMASSDEEITIEKEPVPIIPLATEPKVTKTIVTEVLDERLNQTEKNIK